MLPDPAYITTLILRHLKGEISSQEEAVLQEALVSMQHYPGFAQEVLDADTVWQRYTEQQRFREEQLQEKVLARIGLAIDFKQAPAPIRRVPFFKTAWFRYAAILLLIAGTATLLYTLNQPAPKAIVQHIQPPADIQPGGNKAMLTLSDGSSIVLDSASTGTLASQGGTQIIKPDDGSLAYYEKAANGPVGINTLSTPKGGQYQLVLPDGTKVWLNAASSIRFPTRFGKDRTVEITGESYLEVVPDKNKPFFVKAGSTTIQVLGTSFNVNAYPDEADVKTSLSAGAISVNHTLLKPGQAYLAGRVIATNIAQDLAWKSGYFDFNQLSLRQVMRQLSKWYDVEIVYEANPPNITFMGEIERRLPLSKVLQFMDKAGVHSRLEEGRRLVISP